MVVSRLVKCSIYWCLLRDLGGAVLCQNRQLFVGLQYFKDVIIFKLFF